MTKSLVFESKVVEIEETSNPLLSRVKIQVAYHGRNRNNSNISKAAFEDAKSTIFNCPIVGEYSVKKEDFKDHGGKIVIEDDEIEFVHTTVPYGVINDKAEVTWEIVTEEDGEEREYLCVTGYLWTGRYKELKDVIENSKGQSMEIEIEESSFVEIDGEEVEDITKFIFSAFCILGDDVEPCFESANIATYNLKEHKEDFKNEFRMMVRELKFHLESEDKKQKKGGEKVSNVNFSYTADQLKSELRLALSKVKVDDYGWSYSRFYLQDYMPDKSVVLAYDYKHDYVVGMTYTVDGDAVSIDTESAKRYKVGEWVEMELPEDGGEEDNPSTVTNFAKMLSEKASEAKQFKEDLDKVSAELQTFKEDKEKADETALFERFKDQFSEDEFEQAKESLSNLSLEEKEEKLFALVGKKTAKFKKKDDGGLLQTKVFDKGNVNDPYGGLLSK